MMHSLDCGCGCCTTPDAAIPGLVENRPGLSAVVHRIGTFATFRKAILDELSGTPELAGLTARISDDYTIGAIELWAAVADVLTFYQERIANEAYLGTATLRDSLLRLVRLIDYQLATGAAATANLAFTLEATATAVIPAATRVQSVPGEGETAQKFETLAPVLAKGVLNRLRILPPPAGAQPTGGGSAGGIVAPDAGALAVVSALAPGDRVMFYAPAATEVLTVGSVAPRDDVLALAWKAPISSGAFVTAFDASQAGCRAYKLGRAFHCFGFDAPPSFVVPELIPPPNPLPNPAPPDQYRLVLASTLYGPADDGTPAGSLSLDGRYAGLKAGAVILAVARTGTATVAIPFTVTAIREAAVSRKAVTPSNFAVGMVSGTVTQLDVTSLTAKTLTDLGTDVRNIAIHELLGDPLRFWPYAFAPIIAPPEVFVPARRTGWSTVEVGATIEKGVVKPGVPLDIADLNTGRAVLLGDGGGAPASATIGAAAIAGRDLRISATNGDTATIQTLRLGPDQMLPLGLLASAVLPASVVFPAAARRELSVVIGALTAKTVVLSAAMTGSVSIANVATGLQTAIRAAAPGAATFALASVFAVDNALLVVPGVPGDRIAFGPSTADAATVALLGLGAASVRFLDGIMSAPVTPILGTNIAGKVRVAVALDVPKDIAVTFAPAATAAALATAMQTKLGVRARAAGGDRILLFAPVAKLEPRGFLRIRLDGAAPFALDAATSVLLGNIAPASHGESVRAEILGDGDASQPFQRFALKKKPVTYVPAAVPGGVASSLTVQVNGVAWRQAPTLYGQKPSAQVYVTRIADDGTLTAQFGDGNSGARLPSGRQNVVATYRQGIGVAGRVGANKLTTLLDRPTGVKAVTNPIAADGGADPQTLAGARSAAPGTVRTFGRAVSLRDFEDGALLAGEAAKVGANWVWTGESRAIHLTVAGQGGATFSSDGLKKIAAALDSERDTNHKLLVANYLPVAVLVGATIAVDDRYVAADVLTAARSALLGLLSFENRRFAGPVYLSDVFAVLQGIDGVTAVDVDTLDLKSTDAAFRAAHGIDPSLGQPQPRLLMLPARSAPSSGPVLAAELAVVEVPETDVTLSATGGLVLP